MSESSFNSESPGVTPTLAELSSTVDTVVPNLIEALDNEDAEVKYRVARTLELIGTPNANSSIPALLELFLDETQSISARSAAARALREIAPQTLENHVELEKSLLGIERAIQSIMRGVYPNGCDASGSAVRSVAIERDRQLAMCSIRGIRAVFWWKCRR